MRIGIDVMGSDSTPQELFSAIFRIARENVSFVVFGLKNVNDILKETYKKLSLQNIDFVDVTEEINGSIKLAPG